MTETAKTPNTPDAESASPSDLDRASLVQALKDFEIANARVLDLTQRLLESERARKLAESQLENARIRLGGSLTALLVGQVPSKAAYRMWRRTRKVALETIQRIGKR